MITEINTDSYNKVDMKFKKVLDGTITAEYNKNLKNGLKENEARSNAILTAIINNDPQGILDKPLTKAEQIYFNKYLNEYAAV
jgi:hypothetical protein